MAEHRSTMKNNQNTYNSFNFIDRPMFSHINGKLSPRPFEWLSIRLSWKIIEIRTTPLIFMVDLYSVISMESSCPDLLNDVAEHRYILKNNQDRFYPRFSFTPKTGIASPKTVVLFLPCIRTPMLIWGRLELTETNLTHFNWEVTWTHGNQPNTF